MEKLQQSLVNALHCKFNIVAKQVILGLILTLASSFSAFAQSPCENVEAKAFDWQIGLWQSEDGKQIHEIKKAIDECIVQETWKTEGKEWAVALKSFDNGNHNKTGEKKWFYSWTAKGFHQLWEGRKEEGQWRFYREWWFNGEKVLSRTYWTQISADKLERIVEQSRDDGKTWKPHVKDAFNRVKTSNLASVADSFPVRNAHGLVYDSDLGKAILFGGADNEKVLNDTWAFDGEKWSLFLTNPPPPRTFPAMTYDSVRQVTLLFGGNRVLFGKDEDDYEFLNDFWSFDGKKWSKIETPTPNGRAEASFVFDPERKKAILFGGYSIEKGKIKALSDTWEWDGKSWTKITEGFPSARSGAAMVFDGKRRKIVLFGGGIKNGGASETWEFDGKLWQEIKSAKTAPRYNSTMIYDEVTQKIIRFGGWDGEKRVDETWEFDGKTWIKLSIKSPEARNHTVMVYDSRRKSIVLFGGHNGESVFGDTWEFNGAWRKVISVQAQKRIDNGH